jgi:hypothetical protein
MEDAMCSPVQPVRGNIDRVAHLAQSLGQIIARDFVIFNNQDVHT